MTLRVGSLFSGVGGFDLGLERAGMTTVFQCEWDEKCQSVLRRHWPDVPKFQDVSDVRGTDLPDCDVIAFGSPCQDLSIAGNRAGFDGDRSVLFHEAIRIFKEYQADGSRSDDAQLRYIVWENVFGSFSANSGRDFAAVLDSLGELRDVESIEWRVLDAQWFGVPQRRRRVFVVACLDPRSAGRSQVLPLGARVQRDFAASRTAWEELADVSEDGPGNGGLLADTGIVGSLSASFGGAGVDAAHAQNGWLIPEVSYAVTNKWAKGTGGYAGNEIHNLVALDVLAFDKNNITSKENRSNPDWGRPCHTIVPFGEPPHAVLKDDSHLAVRRLTPLECERLQGWDDDWTRWEDTGKEIADTNRYRMAGNGVCSPVATWIGKCILDFEESLA